MWLPVVPDEFPFSPSLSDTAPRQGPQFPPFNSEVAAFNAIWMGSGSNDRIPSAAGHHDREVQANAILFAPIIAERR